MTDHVGSISQTLPALTQSATGETDFFSAKSTLLVTGTFVGSFTQETTETVVCTARIRYIEVRSVSDSMTIDETVTYYSSIPVTEVLYASSAAGPVSWTTSVRAKPLLAKSSVFSSITVNVRGTLSISEAYVLGRTTSAIEALVVNGRATTAAATFNVTAKSILAVDGRALAGQFEQATSVLTIDDTESYTLTTTQTAGSALQVTDTLTNTVSTFEELSSEFTISDRVSFASSVYNNTATDTVIIRDSYWAADFDAVAWVFNTETTGLSAYNNFGFNSMAVHDGVLYATSPAGVYALTGEDDEGRDVTAEVQTGFLDFDQEQTKRVSDIFVGYTGGELEFDVETYDAPQEVYTYAMEKREMDAPRNNRLKVGRGLSSRYWRFTIRNIDGADFQVYDVTAEVATSKRRL
jgi:hypothetical protein